MAKSIFIEGIDGSGKDTQIQLLLQYFEKQNIPVLSLREPGGSEFYEALRQVHFSDLKRPPISDALLTAAGRAENILQTRQALVEGKWVISNRAYPSSLAYQTAQGIAWEKVRAINDYALERFQYDYRILLDLPVEISLDRLKDAKKDYWESKGLEFFEAVRANYLRVAKEDNLTILDGSSSVESIHKQIVQIIQQ